MHDEVDVDERGMKGDGGGRGLAICKELRCDACYSRVSCRLQFEWVVD